MIQDELGVKITPEQDYIQVGLRDNPKRAQLLVSTILGKHMPTPGQTTWDSCRTLVNKIISVVPTRRSFAVMGYAETAVGIGAMVAVNLDSPFMQSTRILSDERTPYITFSESHSHASDHVVYVDDVEHFERDNRQVMVLVDDEISTGNTVVNTIRALHKRHARDTYVVASFVDSRVSDETFDALSVELNTTIHAVSLVRINLELPEDVVDRATLIKQRRNALVAGSEQGAATEIVLKYHDPTLQPLMTYGLKATKVTAMLVLAGDIAHQLPPFGVPKDAHYLAVEEDMFLPSVVSMYSYATFSSVTRSPAVVIDEEGYPLRSGIEFLKSGEKRWAYNVPTGAVVLFRPVNPLTYSREEFDVLVNALRQHCDEVFVVTIEHPSIPTLESN